MKFNRAPHWKRLCSIALSLVLLCGYFAVPSYAETSQTANLTPDDKSYENGNIILHKQAERIAADEWAVHVKATINDAPVEPPKLEVTFVLDTSHSMLNCTNEYLHTNFWYHYAHDTYYGISGTCDLICTESHTHVDACYSCGTYRQSHLSTVKSCTYVNEEGKEVPFSPNRFEVAKQVIAKMIQSLPAGTKIGRVGFNAPGAARYYTDFDEATPYGDTYMMDGVRLALSKEGDTPCFSNDPTTKKILIIVTDGAASDNDYGASDTAFNNFRNNNGIVYTVGFNHNDPNLSSMVANGGTYSRASNPDELETIFDHITYELTAMIVDPMGEKVDLKSGTTFQPDASVSGDLTFDGSVDTLYWNPEKSADITNSAIEYTYTVKLGSGAGMSAGVHTGVELNKDTYLYYGTSDNAAKEPAEFPQPIAEYAVSTLQVNWKAGGTDLRTPTATESVICDFGTPAFATNYNDIPASITKDGVTYYYQGTEITKNGEAADAVTIADAAAFVVTHQYSTKVTYQVDYEYTGDVPSTAPDADLNDIAGLDAGDTVTIAAEPVLDGYLFSGWSVVEGGVTVSDGSFTMPENNVKLQGSWTKLNGYRVVANYYSCINGGAYTKDNAEPVVLAENLQTPETGITVDISSALTWNGNTYSDPALAEDSAAAVIEGNTVKNIVPSSPAATIIVNLYRNVRTTASVVVRYVDNNGFALRDSTVSGVLYVGEDYDVSAAEAVTSITVDGVIYDFVSDGDAAYTGKVPANGLEITRIYKERAKASVIVHYVDEAGNTLKADTTSGSIYVGNDYDVSDAEDVTSITVDGVIYDFASDGDAAYTGKVPAEGVEITRVYKERAKASVIVHYVDEEGNKLQDDTTSGSIYVGNDYDVSDAEAVTTITVGGKVYKFVSDDDAAYAGKVPAEGVEITRVYKAKAVPKDPTPENTTPNTGDLHLVICVSVLLISLTAITVLLIIKRRKFMM